MNDIRTKVTPDTIIHTGNDSSVGQACSFVMPSDICETPKARRMRSTAEMTVFEQISAIAHYMVVKFFVAQAVDLSACVTDVKNPGLLAKLLRQMDLPRKLLAFFMLRK